MSLDFSTSELCRVARACSAIRIGACTPPYLQRFLEARLRPNEPALARRVAALDPGQVDELCRKLRALQPSREPGRAAGRPGRPGNTAVATGEGAAG